MGRRLTAASARGVVVAALLAACGSKEPAKPRDAAPVVPVADAARVAVDAAAPGRDAGPDGASVTVRVEWKDAPVSARASSGRDRCGDPKPPYARVHTLHGVADAVVWIEGDAPATAPPVTVTLRACALDPAVQVAAPGASLRVASAVEGRVVAEVGWARALAAAPAVARLADLALPIVGHTAAIALDPPAGTIDAGAPWLVRVEAPRAAEPAWIVVAPSRWAAVTDETGAATFTGVPPGTHPVHGWFRPASGQPGRVVDGTVTVTAGADALVTLSLAE